MTLPDRPLTILIAALGGEGGGVLGDWIVAAASARGYPVQSTSIPGVAQRTGATTYYIEVYPVSATALGGRAPVFALTPTPGDIDVLIASELLEAGRAMHSGYVTPQRTTLIASTHRVYTISEKMQMSEGRFDVERVLAAAQLAKRAILFDMQQLAQQHSTVINAVLFGAAAGSGALPLDRGECEAAIREVDKGVEPSLKGFALGFERAAKADGVPAGIRGRLPADARAILDAGMARCREFQDDVYAERYLERIQRIECLDRDPARGLTREAARYLALWMCYEDVIRVADLKTRSARLAAVRAEAAAKLDEPVRVTEFMKPGVEEAAAILPRRIGDALLRWTEKRGLRDKLNVGLHIRTTSVAGFALLRLLAALRSLRRFSTRWHEEQALIERWLALVVSAATRDSALAFEVAQLPRLLKGYGETHRRGKHNFLRVLELVERRDASPAAIRAAREAALADPEGVALGKSFATFGVVSPVAARVKFFSRRPSAPKRGAL